MDEAAFLRLIASAPDDDAPRLIYADWLDERGDPRGAFIRAQCALARLPANDPRRADLEAVVNQLKAAHAAEWTRRISGLVSGHEFRRGFVEEVTLSADALLEHGPELAAAGHLGTVHLPDVGNDLRRVLNAPAMALVRTLDLVGNRVGDAGAAALMSSSRLANLEAIDLSFNGLTNDGVRVLLTRRWPKLRSLDLRGSDGLGRTGAIRIGRSSSLPVLETLDVSDNQLDGSGVWALAHSTALPRLADLRLAGNPVGDAGARALAGSAVFGRQLERIGTLDLSRTQLGSSGIQALVGDPRFKAVQVLKLAGNRIDSEGLIALTLTNLPELRELDLSANFVADEAAYALALSPLLASLLRLDLSDNLLSKAGVGVVCFSEYRNWRTVFEMEGNDAPPLELPRGYDRDAPLPLSGDE
ncbi:MAG: TIGR02996 domain-containing protein [Gemmataceae bacterium]